MSSRHYSTPGRGVLSAPAPSHQPGSERLRGKLLDLGSSFEGLDKKVEEDMRRRTALEQQRINEIALALEKLELTLSREVTLREEVAQRMQQSLDTVLENMTSGLQRMISQRFGSLTEAVESLCERCSTVERGIRQLEGELPSSLRVESAALRRAVQALASDFQADRRQRAERDAHLLAAIDESEYGLDARLQQELAHLERQREALQELIDGFGSASGEGAAEAGATAAGDSGRQRAVVFDSLVALRAALVDEASARERADDQVVQAINQYTATLHRSLGLANA